MAKLTFGSHAEESAFLDQTKSVDFDSFSNDAVRREALGAARALARRLETPVESVWTIAVQSPALYSALKVGMDLDIFAKLDHEDARPKTTQELAGSADVDVVRRMLRHLAAMHFIQNTAEDVWKATRQSSALQRPDVNAGIDFLYEVMGPAFMALPGYLRSTGYKNPTDVKSGNWQYVTKPNKSYFEWLAEHPQTEKTFWNLMTGYAKEPGTWVDVFPTERIIADAKPDSPLIVDIGGAEGCDMLNFLHKHPEASGKLIFQDQSPVIRDAEGKCDSGLVPMVHDFFTPQPIKGARVYFMHRVLHDWSDELGQQILENLKDAMVPGYSRLLINEIIVPRTQANWHETSVDLVMMSLLSSRERSEEAWEIFLRSAGFRSIKFWKSLAAYESVIEVELASK